jgi:L-methionine (R)-S-oxide reductase
MPCDATPIVNALMAKAADTSDPDVLGGTLVEALARQVSQASWVGIYWLRGGELVLGPYVGPATEHVRIPVGRGICGTAVATNTDQVVPDVRQVENYLACSATTRSELVVLIRSMGRVVGQIDLDAERVAAFGERDHCVVRAVADGFGGLLALTASSEAPDTGPAGD